MRKEELVEIPEQNQTLLEYLVGLQEALRSYDPAPPIRGWIVHDGTRNIAKLYGTSQRTYTHFLRILRYAGMVRAQKSEVLASKPIVYTELDLLLVGAYWKTAHDHFAGQELKDVLAPLITKTVQSLSGTPVGIHLARQPLLQNHYERTKPPKPFIIGEQ